MNPVRKLKQISLRSRKILKVCQKYFGTPTASTDFLNGVNNSGHVCRQAGYIALISSIIISILLMGITLAVSSTGFWGRSNILNSEFKERSLALAEACVDTALLKLAANMSYAGNENIIIDNDQCSILAIEAQPGQKIVKTKATFRNAVSDLKVTVNTADLSVVSWEEVPKF